MELEIYDEVAGQAAEIALSGELTFAAAELFERKLEEVYAHKPTELRVIMRNLKYLSSRGIRALLLAQQELKPPEGVIVLIDPPLLLVDSLAMAGLVREIVIR